MAFNIWFLTWVDLGRKCMVGSHRRLYGPDLSRVNITSTYVHVLAKPKGQGVWVMMSSYSSQTVSQFLLSGTQRDCVIDPIRLSGDSGGNHALL